MKIKRITPNEAASLMREGWTLVDVRSTSEFYSGHPAGAYHVPLLEDGAPNPEFMDVMMRSFARDRPLIIGCRTGNRSLRAANMLAEVGYTQVLDMRGGMVGERDAATQEVVCEGWIARELPVAETPEPGRSYPELCKR